MSKNKDKGRSVVIVGNFAEGFQVHGPYENFDAAAEAHPGPDTWVSSLYEPEEEAKPKAKRRGKPAKAAAQTAETKIPGLLRMDPANFIGGTSLQGYITTSYAKLVEILGEPNSESDGYKVSTEWILKDLNGAIFTIYDYKSTSLYDDDYPSPSAFRGESEYDWHIGAAGPVALLIKALEAATGGKGRVGY